MTIHKDLKNATFNTRRTVAKDPCEQERITVNDKVAKPGTEVKEGDIVEIKFGNNTIKVRITKILETVRKEDAADMYEVIQ